MADLVLFPFSIFAALIYGAIVLTAIGAVSLLVLLLRDFLRKSIW